MSWKKNFYANWHYEEIYENHLAELNFQKKFLLSFNTDQKK